MMLVVFVAVALNPNPLSQTWERGLAPLGAGRSSDASAFSVRREGPQSLPIPSKVSIRWSTSSSGHLVVEAVGLTASRLASLQKANETPVQWQQVLSVYVDPNPNGMRSSLPPLLGTYTVRGNAVVFTSRFPLTPGLVYRAGLKFDTLQSGGHKSAKAATSVFRAPERSSTESTSVTSIYPTSDIVPENLLKFYIHFSAPMSRGRIYDHIHLRNSAGKDIELPFLEIGEELWDPTMTRLTLFIDPGRIKRGVKPLEEVGPALEEGNNYTLIIDKEWRDAANRPLKEPCLKAFSVGPPDRRPIDPAKWKISRPALGSRDALTIDFERPLDHALAERVIKVKDSTGQIVLGDVNLSDAEKRWSLLPASPWRGETYEIVVETTIEDLAGNNIGKPFEVDRFDGIQRRVTAQNVKLPFEVK